MVTWSLLLLGIGLVWAVGAYNRLVRLRTAALLAFGALDAHWLRHAQLLAFIPEFLQEPADQGQSETGVIAAPALAAASKQLMASLVVARAQPLATGTIAALAAARSVWDMAWAQALAQCQHHPMAADAAQQWDVWALQAQTAQQHFNDTIAAHDQAVSQFPALLLARLFGFDPVGSL